MEEKLFERVDAVARDIAGSQTKLAQALGVSQGTLNRNINLRERGWKKLFPLIPKIMELYPQLNGEWLRSGKGEMYRDEPLSGNDVQRSSAFQAMGLKELTDKVFELEALLENKSSETEKWKEEYASLMKEMLEVQRENRRLHQQLQQRKKTVPVTSAPVRGEGQEGNALGGNILQEKNAEYNPEDLGPTPGVGNI